VVYTYIHIHIGGGVEYRCSELGRWGGNEHGLSLRGGGWGGGGPPAFVAAGAQGGVGGQKGVRVWCG